MKIAIIANPHFPVIAPFSGGLVAHTYQITRLLMDQGFDVTLFAPEGSDTSLPIEEFCPPSVVQGEKPTVQKALEWEHYFKTLMINIKSRDFDLVHNNSYARTPIDMVSTLDIPMITALHCPPLPSMLAGFKIEKFSDNHYTIAVSETISKLWENEDINVKPEIILNSINTKEWVPPQIALNHKYAVWTGRITAEKGTHLAIKACVKAGIPLKICGPIHDNIYFQNWVEPLLKKYGNFVEYLGCKKTNELIRIVQHASVFVCTPCWEEAFGLVIAEALSCGVPIAGFKRGALPEILNDDIAVLVEEDVGLLAEAIVKSQKLNSLKCRDYAIENFSEEVMIQSYISFYNLVIKTKLKENIKISKI